MVPERFERRDEKPAPPIAFYKRLVLSGLLSVGIILFFPGRGILGYLSFEGLSLGDAFLNASMLMGGMGPVSVLSTDGGKIFAGLYAMFCGFGLIFFGGNFHDAGIPSPSSSLPPGGQEIIVCDFFWLTTFQNFPVSGTSVPWFTIHSPYGI